MLMWVRKFAVLVALASSLVACGGGGGSSTPLFEIDAAVDGRPAGFVIFPGTRQAISVPVGLSFQFDATEPVAWSVLINDVLVPDRGNTYTSAAGTVVQEIVVNNAQYVANTFGFAPGPTPFQITIVATSLEDPGQAATIDVFVTN